MTRSRRWRVRRSACGDDALTKAMRAARRRRSRGKPGRDELPCSGGALDERAGVRRRRSPYMARALALAERGMYTATPNPRVGCVIVGDGSVIGEGWHEKRARRMPRSSRCATPRRRGRRARRDAVRDAGAVQSRRAHAAVRRSALAAGVGRVVAAMADPNALRGGRCGAPARGRHPRRRRVARRRGARAQSAASSRA